MIGTRSIRATIYILQFTISKVRVHQAFLVRVSGYSIYIAAHRHNLEKKGKVRTGNNDRIFQADSLQKKMSVPQTS